MVIHQFYAVQILCAAIHIPELINDMYSCCATQYDAKRYKLEKDPAWQAAEI